jgi:hypothetical protein
MKFRLESFPRSLLPLVAVTSLLIYGAASHPTWQALAQSATGSISGNLTYPADFVPGMVVYAFPVGVSGVAYAVHTTDGAGAYLMNNLPVGVYHVVAYVDSAAPGTTMAAGYTQAAVCGLQANCNDHSLLPVTVAGGSVLVNIDPDDWYAPDGSFPSKPGN